ncbi:MAG: hypothetical protein R6U98_36220, partial [Pirellulaceae bacterium]
FVFKRTVFCGGGGSYKSSFLKDLRVEKKIEKLFHPRGKRGSERRGAPVLSPPCRLERDAAGACHVE